MVDEIAREVGLYGAAGHGCLDEDPQKFLSELFAARHELLTIRTMAAQGGRSTAGDQADHIRIPDGLK